MVANRPNVMQQRGRDEWSIRVRAARLWLREGYTSRERVAELHRLVTASRGKPYADSLREEMRRQWSARSQWMHAQDEG